MPCLEIQESLHHKRSASDLENGSDYSMESLMRPVPENLPSLDGNMKRMKIHDNDNDSSSRPAIFPSLLSDRRPSCRSYLDNSHFGFSHISEKRDTLERRNDHNANMPSSLSLSTFSFRHPLSQVDTENIFGLDNHRNNQLHLNIVRHNTETALKLIKQAPSFDYLSMENGEVQTALHLAVLTNQPTVVRSLICAGAAVDAVDGNLKTPLHLACELGYTDVVQHLLRPVDYTETLGNGYTIPFQRIPQNMELTDADEKTCLQLALEKRKFNVAKMLIDSGALMLPSDLEDTVLDIISRHLNDCSPEGDSSDEDDDDSEEEKAHQDTTDRGDSPGKKLIFEQDDYLSDTDLSNTQKRK